MKERIIKAAHTEEANRKRANSIDYKETQRKREEHYKKLGVKSNFQLEENKQKTRKTCEKKYGTSWTTTKESLKKNRDTCRKKYGVDFVFQSKEFKEKSKKILIKKYGVDSSWEVAYYIWLKHKHINFEYHPQICFHYYKNSRYFPDFRVEDQYIEIKGN